MSAPSVKYTTAASVARSPALDLDVKPERWPAGPPFDALDLRPGRVVMIGAPPGVGKTTLALQVMSGVLATHPNLRAVVGNVEMAAAALVEKLLARLARVPLDAIQDRTFTADERRRVEAANVAHAPLFERIGFLQPPYTLRHMRDALLDFTARLAVVDYAQRFAAGEGDERAKIDALMSGARTLATAGACVLLISSVSRQKSQSGSSTYDGLSMASFRGSAELEFGCDSAYLLHCSKEGIARLESVKQRFGRSLDIPLRFDGALQTFSAGDLLDQYDAAPERRKGKR